MPNPTNFQVDDLRRMVAETGPTTTFNDDDLLAVILRYPLDDLGGLKPTDTAWTGRWDVNLAAAEIWELKAGQVTGDFDFQADGGNFSRSQVYDHCMAMANRYRSRRVGGIRPVQPTTHSRFHTTWPYPYVGNGPEGDI